MKFNIYKFKDLWVVKLGMLTWYEESFKDAIIRMDIAAGEHKTVRQFMKMWKSSHYGL